MTYSAHEILIISPTTGGVLKILSPSQVDEFKYSRVINDVGVFAMVFRGREQVEEVYSLFTTDTLVEVYRDDQTQSLSHMVKENTYLTRKRERYIDDDGIDMFIVGGVDLNDFLNRRIVDPNDDSVQPNGGYATKSGAADTVLRDYIREQAGELASSLRITPGLDVPAVPGIGTAIGKRLRHDILLEVVRDVANSTNIDFSISRITDLSFEVFIGQLGTDRTYNTNKTSRRYVVFSPNRGNLLNPRYSIDETEEVTYLYVLGPGQGTNRTQLELSNNARVNASPYNRIERVKDARDTQPGQAVQLLTEGRLELIDQAVKIEFNANISAQLGGTKYRIDWVLGDRVTIAWGNQRDDVRIIGIEITLTGTGEQLVIKIEQNEGS